MANRVRDGRKEALWREVLRRQETAGVSVREFCRREGVAESNFYAWRRTIAQRDGVRGARKRPVGAKRVAKARRSKKADAKEAVPAFVRVVAGELVGNRPDIVLELRGGRRLRLDGATSPERLASIVWALESEGAA